tara:strand:+ start:117 stop:308 length:192 start_codon:yes stop_codon:yes gene_type:complete
LRKPNGRKPASAELVDDFITAAIISISKVDRVEPSGFISLQVFGITNACQKETRGAGQFLIVS